MRPPADRPPWGRSLSARLLLLTVGFLLLGEILIFVPSIARFRHVYLEERIAAAHLATIGVAARGQPPSLALADALLSHAGVLSITIERERPVLMLGMLPPVERTIDITDRDWVGLILEAFSTLYHGGQRVVRVVGPSPMEYGTTVDITLTEAMLHAEMIDYARRIILLSFALSLIVGLLLLASLRSLIVRPLARITAKIAHFRKRPEDSSLDTPASRRSDEIGIVDREVDAMTRDLRQALAQKTRLAALGEAVGKLHHDLRNILATAFLLSDRLEGSADPAVRAVTPRLVQTLERAIRLCQETLDFARSRPPRPSTAPVALRALVDEVTTLLSPAGTPTTIVNEIAPDVMVVADPDQLHRLFLNLARNALEAMPGGGQLTFRNRRVADRFVVEVEDTGHGLPETVRDHLFEPFTTSSSGNGAGLGLAICREIARAHGGDLQVRKSDDSGTVMTLTLPAMAGSVGT
jgi:signal transduction histidine kinase